MSQGLREQIEIIAVAVAIVVVLAVVGLWYFKVYDTAAGKCNRGDVGACMVWQAQQTPLSH